MKLGGGFGEEARDLDSLGCEKPGEVSAGGTSACFCLNCSNQIILVVVGMFQPRSVAMLRSWGVCAAKQHVSHPDEHRLARRSGVCRIARGLNVFAHICIDQSIRCKS